MAYSIDHLRTAGKITVYTTLIGVVAFAVVFMFNIGERHVKEAVAQDIATTSVTVLNIAPQWTASSTELIESSSDNPTNEGDAVSWVAVGTDSNAEDYWLLICSNSATPTANSSAPPTCHPSAVQWARSATTTSGTQALAATTTTASTSPFAGESFPWFGFICDGNAISPRCNTSYSQGTNATNSSPFEVNHRPTFTAFVSPVSGNPGQTVTFTSTSDDDDVSGTPDTVFLTVCATAGFATTTNTCTGTTLATSTAYVSANATSTYTIVIPTQDTNYSVFPYIIDQHGLEALGGQQGVAGTLTVNNVAPVVTANLISLVQPTVTDLYLTVEAGETTGFRLSFVTEDDNSCDAIGGGLGDEVVDYELSIYRSGVGSTTCAVSAGSYNANSCYPSGVGTSVWNLTCTASTTTCTGATDVDMTWNCTFPLWYIADPTDGTATSTQYSTQNWLAQVQGVDDDGATGTPSESASGVEVRSFLAFALNTLSIPYGSLEPGQETPTLVATTTVAATGNVGVDKDVIGTDMCTTYSGLTPCNVSASSTIPAFEQVFATSTVTYAQGTRIKATSTTFVDINVHKSISTSTPTTSNAYWGIRVPSSISLAGDYTGENTFTARVSEQTDW